MTAGSNQPYLFPYIGYWQLMSLSDVYVISDSMQYIKKGYVNRNNILVDNKRHLITLEVIGAKSKKQINEVEVGSNRKKILNSIFHAYKKAPYFETIFPMIEKILLHEERNLAKFLGNSIETIASYLDIKPKFIYLSELQGDTPLRAQARTIDICKRVNADHYVNAIGGQNLYNKKDFEKEEIRLNFLKTGDIEYKQFGNQFIPNLSIIDIMMFNSREEIKTMLQEYILI